MSKNGRRVVNGGLRRLPERMEENCPPRVAHCEERFVVLVVPGVFIGLEEGTEKDGLGMVTIEDLECGFLLASAERGKVSPLILLSPKEPP